MRGLGFKNTDTALWLRRFLLGALVGAVIFILIFGFKTLDPTDDSWIRNGFVEEDIIQHYATWQYFRNDNWQFSLTWMDNVAGPEGVAAAWGDVYPWAALIFKALSPILPDTFQYMGIAALLHFMLQGGFAWVLMALFDERWQLCLSGSLLFCLWPPFLERIFRHMALSAQWLVPLMLYLYFIARRREKLPWFWWCVVFGLIPGIHPYYLPMAFGLVCASALEAVIKRRKVWGPLLLVAACMAITLVSARGLGVLMPGASTGDGGFGKYSMNLNSIINPLSADFLSESGELHWSLLLPTLERPFYQYDSFNYLGLGVLIAIAAIAVYGICRLAAGKALKRALGFLGSHIGLVIASLAFTLFALSNRIYAGETLIIDVPLPEVLDSLFSTFRASGRIFWPVGYLIALGVLVFISRHLSGKKLAAALVLLLVIQFADMGGILLHKADSIYAEPQDLPYQGERVQQLMASAEEVRCLEGPIFDYRFAESIIRYNPRVQTNIVFFPKGNFVDTYSYYPLDEALLLSGDAVPESALYVTSDRQLCLEILAEGHESLAAWQLEDFYLIGAETDARPAPDLE